MLFNKIHDIELCVGMGFVRGPPTRSRRVGGRPRRSNTPRLEPGTIGHRVASKSITELVGCTVRPLKVIQSDPRQPRVLTSSHLRPRNNQGSDDTVLDYSLFSLYSVCTDIPKTWSR